jgi:hypothetical protein
MKPDEKLAYPYLVSLGLGSVVYEPEPNKPPDFLINGTIAVEVRRLNQNKITAAGYEGLETAQFNLHRQIQPLLPSFCPCESGTSWFVLYNFERPIAPAKVIRSALIGYLRRFRDNVATQIEDVISARICAGFEVELRRASKQHSNFFVLGGNVDEDSGGFIVAETLKNLTICVKEKTQRTAAFRHLYPEWWLVLIDRIGYCLDANDRELLREHFQLAHNWDKILLLNAENPMSAFELTEREHDPSKSLLYEMLPGPP